MKILIVNTSERVGGAAIAANRLMEALRSQGVQVEMLVRDKTSDSHAVTTTGRFWLMRLRFLWERLVIFFHLGLKREHLFEIDIANTGFDLTRAAAFKNADVIHLHWINQGMLSLKNIRRILESGKPVVWTMHDMWPATAICHYALGCRRFTSRCGDCRLLPGHSDPDFSTTVWERKQKMLQGKNIHFVACSRWLENEAKCSALLQGQLVTNIPNPIDIKLYHPADKTEAKRKLGLPTNRKLILFAAQRAVRAIKGMNYLIEACRLLETNLPVGLIILGGDGEVAANELPFPAYPQGYVSDEQRVAELYHAADVFVLPSLSDNLPNTIMEALACGTPCVGFNVGGIPEMIDHKKNGYVAQYKNAEDLSKGIRWTLFEADGNELSHNAVEKVTATYSQQTVAARYMEVYNAALQR